MGVGGGLAGLAGELSGDFLKSWLFWAFACGASRSFCGGDQRITV